MSMTQSANGFPLDDGGKRIVVDPVTRIEGHLRIEVNLDGDNVIRNAVSVGTMWRGIETILKGRDPRDAWSFTQRICGVCTGIHALASVRAVEDALGIDIPENANIIRNLMTLALYVQDHLVHFYHLHALDWVDVVSALQADPVETEALARGISPWGNNSAGRFADVKQKLERFVKSGQLGPFANAYWGHPGYRLPPEANLMAVSHYLEALDFQLEIVKIHTIFGGKNPHPNWVVGGVPCAINVEGAGAIGAVNLERLNLVASIIERSIAFIDQVYIPDLLAIASFYKDWTQWGGGLAGKNMLSYGEIPEHANDHSPGNLLLPRGAIVDGRLEEVHEVDLHDEDQVREHSEHAWYDDDIGPAGRHPFDGLTVPRFDARIVEKDGRRTIERVDETARYSWIKAPRWRGHAMEVGPLARYVIGYAQGNPEFKEPVDMVLGKLGVPLPALFSTLGRTAARGLEASWAAHKMRYFLDRLMTNLRNGNIATANTAKWTPETWPPSARGAGFAEAPRGALGHWLTIEQGRIDNYQCVVPTTWNASPRDPAGNIGTYEAALLGTPMADAHQPLEILRTIHSFDPCLACATHVMAEDGRELVTVKVL